MVEFPEAVKSGFTNYFNFSGRATRAEYWWFVLFTQLISFIGVVPILGWIISIVGTIAALIPSISLTVRRLHDIGKSAWWIAGWFLLAGVPWIIWSVGLVIQIDRLDKLDATETEWEEMFVNWFIGAGFLGLVSVAVFIWWLVWFVRKGDQGPNKYGPDPRQPVPPES